MQFQVLLVYTAAPEMKNHLSTLPSIGAGGRFWPAGMLAVALWSTSSLDSALVRLALCFVSDLGSQTSPSMILTYRLISPAGEAPVMSRSQASEHSRITSRAYLIELLVLSLRRRFSF
jgi:hypothetical protein